MVILSWKRIYPWLCQPCYWYMYYWSLKILSYILYPCNFDLYEFLLIYEFHYLVLFSIVLKKLYHWIISSYFSDVLLIFYYVFINKHVCVCAHVCPIGMHLKADTMTNVVNIILLTATYYFILCNIRPIDNNQ